MRLIQAYQARQSNDPLNDLGQMLVPIIRGFIHSLKKDRVEILKAGHGGFLTLEDLAREHRESHGDVGTCFELAVHEWICAREPYMLNFMSDVLRTCRIFGEPQSLLFAPEKQGQQEFLASAEKLLTEDSRLYTGRAGRPVNLMDHVESAFDAFGRPRFENDLPPSIKGLWKTDFFVGTQEHDAWVAVTAKHDRSLLEPAPGLRIGIYPGPDYGAEAPIFNEELGLWMVGLPYDRWFLEIFYKAFNLFKQFLTSAARMPRRDLLPGQEEREMAAMLVEAARGPIETFLAAIGRTRTDGPIIHAGTVAQVGESIRRQQPTLFDPEPREIVIVAPVPALHT